MIILNRLIGLKHKFNCMRWQCLRLQSNLVEDHDSHVSSRKQAWLAAQQKYINYEHVHYSSYLERLLEPKNRWRDGHTPRIIVYPTLDEIKQMTVQDEPQTQVPANWMDDYEFYEGAVDEAGNINSKHGTPDPTVPASHVPCNGCGAHLHCAIPSVPGYIPSEIFKGRTNADLRTITCQRCHFLKHYNIALDVEVTAESYVETISSIKDKYALAVVIVDLMDLPSSIWPDMQTVLGSKRPVFIVGNKVDLLPRDCNGYLDHIKRCLKQQFVEYGGFDGMNIKNISLISAKTGYGIEELITQLHKIWKHKGDVYLMGCTNVGKSTLFNILLNSDYCRPEATELIRKATTCPWPGTTLQMLKFPILRPSDIRIYERFRRLFSERAQRAAEEKLRRAQASKTGSIKSAQLIGEVGRTFESRTETLDSFALSSGTQPITTLNERKVEYREAKWCYDTPGVMQPDQITNILTANELLKLQPQKMISPRAFRLKPSMSLLLAGLARLDFLGFLGDDTTNAEWIKVFVFSSLDLPVVITSVEHAVQVYDRYLGTELLGVPENDTERLTRWPGLQCRDGELVVKGAARLQENEADESRLNCDITFSSAGWMGILLPRTTTCAFRAWTPHARGIYVRTPSLIPLAPRLVGKHIRNSLAYNMAKPFIFKK